MLNFLNNYKLQITARVVQYVLNKNIKYVFWTQLDLVSQYTVMSSILYRTTEIRF